MLTLICGLPNAGKTTYSARYDNVIHCDDIPHRTSDEMFEKCHKMLSEIHGDICVDGVYVSIERRKQLLDACGHQDKKVCIWIDTPYEECLERERNYRKRPLDIVHTHHRMFQPPTLDEGWDEVIIER